MSQIEMQSGDRVEWYVGKGRIHERLCVGTIERMNVDKFGFDDIVVVNSDTSDKPEYIRPHEVERVVG